MQLNIVKAVAAIILVALVGCSNNTGSKKINVSSLSHSYKKFPDCTWERVSNNFSFYHDHDHDSVDHFISHYSKDTYHMHLVTQRARPYLHYIITQLEKNNLPGELALIPMIESAYHPIATSSVGAAGVWQLNGVTGKFYDMKLDPWFDARFNIVHSTNTAIMYFKFLEKKYNGDWLTALAAYNAGHGRVNRAIRKNKARGKRVDYWSLDLPRETKQFVPKFLAMANIIANPNKYQVKLNRIPNKEYLTTVTSPIQIDMYRVAELSEIPLKDVKMFNHSYTLRITHPNGPHEIVLPLDAARKFSKNLAIKMKDPKWSSVTTHTVKSGDNLTVIARKYKTTIKSLLQKNKLKSDFLKIGQKIKI